MTGISTRLVHDADALHRVSDVIPPINIATTYAYDSNPDKLVKWKDHAEEFRIDGEPYYSRLSHPNSTNVEKSLSGVLDGHVVAYSSGLGAFFAALTYFNPKVIAIGRGYHGCHGIVDLFVSKHGAKQIDLDDDYAQAGLGEGDVVHLETPVNPEGVNFNIDHYARRAHAVGAILIVDSTFAPPPLQHPFKHGADIIMHSATKFFGGHSDLLAGLLVTKSDAIKQKLLYERLLLGTNIGNLESALLLRSLKTFELRITQQSRSATQIVHALVSNQHRLSSLVEVYHGSLQPDEYIATQLSGGQSPVFSIKVKDEDTARTLPSKLKYFHHATSLGGVESLIEWRAMSDPSVDTALLRVSVGVENVDDLIGDLINALS